MSCFKFFVFFLQRPKNNNLSPHIVMFSSHAVDVLLMGIFSTKSTDLINCCKIMKSKRKRELNKKSFHFFYSFFFFNISMFGKDYQIRSLLFEFWLHKQREVISIVVRSSCSCSLHGLGLLWPIKNG